MKRSRINEIMRAADDLIRHHGFVLPPFAYWTPEEFKARTDAGAIVQTRMGWDITDYGQGRFDEMGLFLFTLLLVCVLNLDTFTLEQSFVLISFESLHFSETLRDCIERTAVLGEHFLRSILPFFNNLRHLVINRLGDLW